MKHTFKRAALALALILALALSVAALAEAAGTDEAQLPDDAAQQPAESAETSDSTALEDALDAYYDAKDSSRAADLEAELNEYVASGKLTQEQADLILNYYKEQQALRDGVCPNCGYAFQSGSGWGGRTGKGGRGMHGKGGRGGFGMRGMAQSYDAGDAYFGDPSDGIGAAAGEEALTLGVLESPFAVNFL